MTLRDDVLARFLREYPDVVLVLSNEGRLLWANDTAEEFFNQSLEDAIGTSVLTYVHPDDLELVLRSLESVQGKHKGNPLEIRASIDGEWHLLETVGVPVSWYAPGAVLFSFRDLTNRRRFEVARNDIARFRSLVQNASTIMLLLSANGVVESVSAAVTRLLGHDPEVVENHPLADLVVAEDRPVLQRALDEALGPPTSHSVVPTLRLLHHNGSEATPYELSFVNLIDDPTVQGLVVTANDISARVQTERELHDAIMGLHDTYSLLEATLDSTPDGILVVNEQRRITGFNKQFTTMWGVPDDVVELDNDAALLELISVQLEDPEQFRARVEELYSQPDVESSETLYFKDGRVFDRFSKPQYVNDVVVGRVWSFRDITEQKQLEDDLSHRAFHDVLTGLANRALFRDRLNQAIARNERTAKYPAVLFVDLDHFKPVNDSLGHSSGDLVLKAVAERLRGCLRHSDTAARMGGDEFAVLIEEVHSREEIISLATRIMSELRRPLAIGNQHVSVTASIGITFGVEASTSEQLIHNADLAMYLAKAQGRDRYAEFQDHLYSGSAARLEMEEQLRRVNIDKAFIVHYQPIVQFATNTVVGLETLVRWAHPAKGLLTPVEFMAFAEEIGLVRAISTHTVVTACAQLQSWRERGLVDDEFFLGINLTTNEFSDTRSVTELKHALASTGLSPAQLVIEVSERALMKDPDVALETTRTLKTLGVRVAIDHFGSGLSSLAHLSRLPIDFLKIDESFVKTVGHRDDADLSQIVVQLAHSLGLATIADGVERDDHVAHLRSIDCDMAQGPLLSPALSADETEDLLRGGVSDIVA
ncbi:MAG: sensor domain-containing protein [Acidimicrobiales bacterium]